MRRRTLRSFGLLLAVGAFLSCTRAPRADIVFRNARLFVGDGTVLENATVAVDGDRIAAIETGESAMLGSLEIDASGWTVLPGLIDTHVHLMALEAESAEAVAAYRERALPGLLRQYLEQGITTVRSTGDPWPAIAEVREQLRAGELAGPRLLMAGPVLTARDGHPAVTVCGGGSWAWCREHLARELDDAQGAREAVSELASGGVDFLKVAYEDELGARLHVEILRAILEEAGRLGLPVEVHGAPDTLAVEAIEEGVSGLVHPPFGELEVASWIDVVAGRAISTTVGAFAPFEDADGVLRAPFGSPWNEDLEWMRRRIQTSIKALWDAGRGVAFGTDLPVFPPQQAFFHEAEALLAAGLSPSDVTVLATAAAAEALGLFDELGTVAAGKTADLLVVSGDPATDLESLRSPLMVLQRGVVVVDHR